MSETFIKIDSLQHLEISRQNYHTNWSKISATAFTVKNKHAEFFTSYGDCLLNPKL